MRKVLVAVIGIAAVGIGTTIFVMLNLDDFVKDAIQAFASEAVKTQVRVAEVKLALESGEASIIDLNVSNPDGFSSQNIFELGMISAKIDATTLNQNPIMIDEVIISMPSIMYEINKSGKSNVDVLIDNLAMADDLANSNSDGRDGDLKMIIGKLIVERGRIKVRVSALSDAEQSMTLPTIEIFDIGKKDGGMTSVEVARLLSSKLLDSVNSSVAQLDVEQYLEKPADIFNKSPLD